MKIKRAVSFVCEPIMRKGKDLKDDSPTEGRVRCVVTWCRMRTRFSTGVQVNVDGWEQSLQRCRAKTSHGKMKVPASVINRELDDFDTLVNGLFDRFEETDTVPTADDLRGEFDRVVNGKDSENTEDNTIFPIYDKFLADGKMSGRWSADTEARYRLTGRRLREILPSMTFADLDDMGISGMIKYLSGCKDNKKEKGLSNRTTAKHVSLLKCFVRWAMEKGYCDNGRIIHQRARLKTAKRPVIFLDWEELMRVYNYDFGGKNYLAHVRDVFCFCCFTSLRYSDAYNLKRANVSDDSISVTTQKTSDSIVIELNKYSRAILDRYSDVKFPGDKALPVISNQRMNDYLKEIGKMCGLDEPIMITTFKGNRRFDRTYKKWELLSTHAGRRTFVCNALTLGIPADIVMKWTGHSDYKAMRPYIEIADNAKRKAMTKFDMI